MAAMRLFPEQTLYGFWGRLGFVFGLTIVLSEVTYRFVEVPAESRKSFARADQTSPARAGLPPKATALRIDAAQTPDRARIFPPRRGFFLSPA